jgi:hypothetical protein
VILTSACSALRLSGTDDLSVCYFGYASVQQLGKVCLVMEDTFDNGINSDFWSHEVRLDGFG